MAEPTGVVRLGSSNVVVTRLGLGLAPIGGLYSPVSPATAGRTIDRAWQLGVRLFDTAPYYGRGESERRTGSALRRRPRGQFVLSTKVGRLLIGEEDIGSVSDSSQRRFPEAIFDFTNDGVRRSLDESRSRLGIDRLDVVHIHDPDDYLDAAITQAFPALDHMRASGEIGAISVGTNRVNYVAPFVERCRLDCFMIAGRYTLLDQTAFEEALPVCRANGVSVLAAGVYNSGILASPRQQAYFDYRPAEAPVLARALAIEAVCRQHDVPLRSAAIQFPLAHPAVAAVVVGARSPAEVDDAVDAMSHPIPPQLWSQLKHEGLLPAAVPTPT